MLKAFLTQTRLLLTVALFGGTLHAQTLPDAGALKQQVEPSRTMPLPEKGPSDAPPGNKDLAGTAPAATQISAFRFEGNTLLSDRQLQEVVKSAIQRPLSFSQLQMVARNVTAAYRDAGWIVATLIPAQDITEGVVTLVVVEALFGAVHFEGVAPSARHLDFANYFLEQQKTGNALGAPGLDRALLLVDDLPGVVATGALRQGLREREVDLFISLADQGSYAGELRLDNFGERSTGSERAFLGLRRAGLVGVGDVLDTSLLYSDGTAYARLGYTVPVGSGGWRAGVNASRFDYRLVTADFAGLDAKGSSTAIGLEASYPLLRSRARNLYVYGDVSQKSFDNQSTGATQSFYRSHTITTGLSGNRFDALGGAASSASVAISSGTLNLDDSPNQAADSSTTQTAGTFGKIRYSADHQQTLRSGLSVFGSVMGQLANNNLDSSEKFYLGGPNGVRAYPANEGAGAEGKLLSLEMRWQASTFLKWTAFYDYGEVTVNRYNQFAGAADLNIYTLRGAGLSATWQPARHLVLKATWSQRIGDNPNPAANGNDKDGTLTRDRFWLSVETPY